MPVPDIDSKTFQLKIVGKNNEEKVLSLDDIKTFPKCTVTAVIQCAGNRRSEMSKVKVCFLLQKSKTCSILTDS